jgi:hypothetical protein
MTTKNYLFWNNENIYQAPATKTMPVDQWQSITSATLTWRVTGTSGFDDITFNGVTLGTGDASKTGSADVLSYLQQGTSNRVVLNYKSSVQTILFGEAAGNVNVTLTVTGTLPLSYAEILAQNARFKQAVEAGEITEAEYIQAINYQNAELLQLFQWGNITQKQYDDAIAAEQISTTTITAPTPTDTTTTPTDTTVSTSPVDDVINWFNQTNATVGVPNFALLAIGVVALIVVAALAWTFLRGGAAQ